jgi:hypothetical protein
VSVGGDDGQGPTPIGDELSPSMARRRLGALLRAARERAHVTLDGAARPALQRSAATLSRLENGKVKPRLLEIHALLDLYAAADPGSVSAELRALADALAEAGRRATWFGPYADVLTSPLVDDDTRRFLELEADASRIQSYQPDVVPGLLQTPGYVRAIADTYYSHASSRERDRWVEFRLDRQRAVARRGSALDVHVVIGEQALLRFIGGPEVMREQLGALAAASREGTGNIRMQIAPMSLTIRGAIGGAFLVMRFDDEQDVDFVYLEGRSGADYLENPGTVAQYQEQFADLAAASLDREASLARLEEAIKTIR